MIDDYLAAIGWSARELASRLDAHPNTVNDWRLSRRKTPEAVTAWLAELARCHGRNLPPDWRKRPTP